MMRQRRAAVRDVAIPKLTPKQRRRRASTKHDPMAFAKTYFEMDLPFSELLHAVLYAIFARIVTQGGNQALAAPRGHGKDSTLKIVVLWAILHGHLKFVLLICANKDDAVSRLADIKFSLETNDLLCQDFPEVCLPIRALEGAAQRAKSQTVNGARTRIEWHASEIRLPDVKGSAASGTWLMARGIDGQILGIVREEQRPGFYIVSDPETEESVESEVMTAKIRKKFERALPGIGGPGKKISGAILCTIRKDGCIADEFTDPKRRPAWNGLRFKAILEWPERRDLWEQYIEIRNNERSDPDDTKRDENARGAHRFYLENREEMDRGAVVIWPERFIPDVLPDGSQIEVSALQSYFNFIADHGEEAFFSEYQNAPIKLQQSVDSLTADTIASKLSGSPRNVLPEWADRLSIGVDVGKWYLHYTAIAASSQDGTAAAVDHGVIKIIGEADEDVRNLLKPYQANMLTAMRRARDVAANYVRNDGSDVSLEIGLIDGRYETDVVRQFVAESGPRWRVSFGHGKGQGMKPFSRPKPGQGVKVATNYYGKWDATARAWSWHVNADYWKQYVHDGLRQVPGSQGCLTLYGNDPRDHKTFARHLTAEQWDPERNQWIELSDSNHWFDSTALAMCALDMIGVKRVRREVAVVQSAGPEKKIERRPQEQGWVRRGGGPWFRR